MSWWLVRCVVREGKGNTNKSGVQSLGNWVDVGAILFNRWWRRDSGFMEEPEKHVGMAHRELESPMWITQWELRSLHQEKAGLWSCLIPKVQIESLNSILFCLVCLQRRGFQRYKCLQTQTILLLTITSIQVMGKYQMRKNHLWESHLLYSPSTSTVNKTSIWLSGNLYSM